MSAIVEEATKVPSKIVSEGKQLVGEAMKPASKNDMRSIAIGSVTGALLTPAFNRFLGWIESKIPISNPTIFSIIRALAPFGIAYGIYKTKLPLGNILAGGFLGVGIMNAINWIITLFSGGLDISNISNRGTQEVTNVESESNPYF